MQFRILCSIRHRRLKLLQLGLAALLVLPGCGHFHVWPWKKKPPRATLPSSPRAVGTVVLVNEEAMFVLIDDGLRAGPAVGTLLKINAPGASPTELRVTQIQRPPFIIADIIRGTARKGDKVFQ